MSVDRVCKTGENKTKCRKRRKNNQTKQKIKDENKNKPSKCENELSMFKEIAVDAQNLWKQRVIK